MLILSDLWTLPVPSRVSQFSGCPFFPQYSLHLSSRQSLIIFIAENTTKNCRIGKYWIGHKCTQLENFFHPLVVTISSIMQFKNGSQVNKQWYSSSNTRGGHFLNNDIKDTFQSYYDLFWVNWLVQNYWHLYKS